MKSRNLKAIFASVLTVALLATAMTGFAATVTTKSTYNTGTDKVAVTTSVNGATADSEVTYLVKNGEGDIVYIDQDTAANGAVKFEYKIAQTKIADYATTVKFGTDATDEFAGTGKDTLGFAALKDQSGDTYTVTYANDVVAAGIGEKVTANIAAKDGYEIVDVKVNGESKTAVNSVEVDNDDVITVETKKSKVDPAIQVYKDLDGDTFTAVIKPTGDGITEFGIEYALFEGTVKQYKSLETDMTKMAAVQLILPEDKEAEVEDFVPYFVAEGVTSKEYTEFDFAQ
jgi:hypothetical protein